jgi:hypothetical protein
MAGGLSRARETPREEDIMTTQQDMSKPAAPESGTARTSSLYEEGIVAGLLGAATIAVWFLILDTIQGRPLYTPTVLGTALFRSGVGLTAPENLVASFELVIWFTWVHVLVFVVLGSAAAWLLGLAERDPNFGFGILLFLVVFMFGFIGVSLVFAEEVLHALAWPAILIGNLLAAGAMAWYFWRRHPQLTIWP